ncbi:cell wall metabolism sensor histidine kinase WalK [Paenibacillus sp. GbtcB18]|uniref:sensor histidine kinase n=1 Tax=Paenibacillus sp. GbtcB18 TaxID=2824763 RepID=UPI001C304DD5|nr:HAMP domain-containing sensor histidine kinase [Paenibacillus sp. GbtcB18]
MKTLYVRIVVTFLLIAVISSAAALLLSNSYYSAKLRDYNEQKIMRISQEIRGLYEEFPGLALGEYLTRIANMGFQVYAVDDSLRGTFYGSPFKHKEIERDTIVRVLNGETYHGVMEERHLLLVTGFFENSIRNSIGLPVRSDGKTIALFIRPDMEQQIGEVRILMALLLGFTFLLSLVLIVISTRFIVKPVQKLTEATNKIVGGDYNIRMDVTRRDEIGNLARHFTQMAQSLEKLDQMRQEFVANVSHEIQSPLTTIQGFAQSMLEKGASPEEEQRYLRIIEEESRRLSSLSKELLTLAALDKETSVLKPSSFRLDEQIRQIFITTEWQWTEKELQLQLDLPEMVIRADSQLLHQVWLNLIANSIKFTRPGDTISVQIRQEQQEILVSIGDTGPGIPPEDLPHIFDRFYKGDKSRNRSRSGSGLGLSIAHKIVALHRGSIEAKSLPGEGTVFQIWLPKL